MAKNIDFEFSINQSNADSSKIVLIRGNIKETGHFFVEKDDRRIVANLTIDEVESLIILLSKFKIDLENKEGNYTIMNDNSLRYYTTNLKEKTRFENFFDGVRGWFNVKFSNFLNKNLK